jgi:hypothetical protein
MWFLFLFQNIIENYTKKNWKSIENENDQKIQITKNPFFYLNEKKQRLIKQFNCYCWDSRTLNQFIKNQKKDGIFVMIKPFLFWYQRFWNAIHLNFKVYFSVIINKVSYNGGQCFVWKKSWNRIELSFKK